MTKAFIFDMDGVIIDSEPLQLQSFNVVLKKYQIEVPMKTFKQKYMGLKDIEICDKMIDDHSISLTKEDFVKMKREAYLDILENGDIKPINGATEAIQRLRKKFSLAIASSSNKSEI